MLLAIDLEYERKLLEEDRARATKDREAFTRDSEIIQAGITMDEINKSKQILASTKTKAMKPHSHTKGLVFEPSKFDEETYRRRRQELQHQMKSRRSESPESSSSSEDISEPPSPITEQTVKIPPPAPRKYRSPSASESSSASSDESFTERKRSKKEKKKKNHTFESSKNSSPIRKSPKKNDYGRRSISPVKPLKEKKEKSVVPPVIKQKVPPSLPPGYSSLESMKFGNYKIPKIGETAKSHMPKPMSPKKEIVTESKETSHKIEGVVKPFTIKFNDFNAKHVNEKESDKTKVPKPDHNLPSSRPLSSIKLTEIQSKSSADSSLPKEREPLITKISTKGFDSVHTVPPIKLSKERKEIENKKVVVSENVNISTEYSKKKPEPTPMAAPLKLKISVGGIKTEEMTEEERKKDKKRKKKEKKERERLEREGKEMDKKYLKKLKKEKRRAEKEERKRQEQLQKEAGNQMSNVSSVNSNPATPDPKRLVVRIKMQEPEPPKPVQNNPPPASQPQPQPPPLGIPKLTMKLPKPIKEELPEHHEHKKEKKEKKKHKKEESQAESSKTPPRKIQKLTIKIGQNSGASSSDHAGSHGRHENPPVLPRQNSSHSQSSMSMNRFSPPPTLTNQFIPEADLSNDTSFSSTGPSMSMFDTSLMPRSGNASSLSMVSKPQSELEVKDLKAITGNILLRIRDQ